VEQHKNRFLLRALPGTFSDADADGSATGIDFEEFLFEHGASLFFLFDDRWKRFGELAGFDDASLQDGDEFGSIF